MRFPHRPSPAWWLAVFGGLAAALFLPVWLQGNLYAHFDLASLTIPLEDLFARSQRAGSIPFWSPEVQMGYPLLGNGVASFFHPLHLLLRAVLPGAWVANLSLALHLVLAAGGMWLFLRAERLRPAAAATGGLLFATGGFFVGRLGLAHQLFPLAFLPLALWALARWWETRRSVFLAAASAFASLVLTVGHLQAGVTAAAVLPLAALAWVLRHGQARPWIWVTGSSLLIGVWTTALSAGALRPVVDTFWASTRALPLTGEELFDVSYVPRHILTWVFPYAFGHLEGYFGAKNEFELASFFGVAGTALGALALCQRRTYRSASGVLAALLLIAGLSLATGPVSPVYRFLVEQEVLRQVANPARFFVFLHLAWSILAAHGTAALAEVPRRGRARLLLTAGLGVGLVLLLAFHTVPRADRARTFENLRSGPHGLTAAAAGLVAIAAASLWPRPAGWIARSIAVVVGAELLWVGSSWNPAEPRSLLLRPPAMLADLAQQAGGRIYSHQHLFAGPRPDYGVAVWHPLSHDRTVEQPLRTLREVLRGVDILLSRGLHPPGDGTLTAELLVDGKSARLARVATSEIQKDSAWVHLPFSRLALPRGSAVTVRLRSTLPQRNNPPRLHFYANHGTDDARAGGRMHVCERGRCTALPVEDSRHGPDLAVRLRYEIPPVLPARELLLPLSGESQGLQFVRGHLPLSFPRVARLLRAIGEHPKISPENNVKLAENRPLLDRLGVGSVLASYEDEERFVLDGLREVAARDLGEDTARLYRNDRALPRLHFARRVIPVQVGEHDANTIQLASDALPRDAVLGEAVPFETPRDFDTSGTLDLLRDESTELRVRTHTGGEAYLVVRDTSAPGWEATIDGKPTLFFATDVAFRGLIVPAGEHEVAFRYRRPAWKRAASISLVGWLATAAVIALGLWHRPRRATGVGGGRGGRAGAFRGSGDRSGPIRGS